MPHYVETGRSCTYLKEVILWVPIFSWADQYGAVISRTKSPIILIAIMQTSFHHRGSLGSAPPEADTVRKGFH